MVADFSDFHSVHHIIINIVTDNKHDATEQRCRLFHLHFYEALQCIERTLFRIDPKDRLPVGLYKMTVATV